MDQSAEPIHSWALVGVIKIRPAIRAVRRSPGFFAIAVTILALGVGTSAAMFSLFRTVLVRQLPVVDQDRIVVLWTYAADPNTEVSLGTKDHSAVRQNSRTLRDVAARQAQSSP